MLAFCNTVMLLILMVMIARSWTQVFYMAIVEVVYIILLVILGQIGAMYLEVTLYFIIVLYMVTGGVELVVFFLFFIVYYHVTEFAATGTTQPKSFKFYVQEFKKTDMYTTLFL